MANAILESFERSCRLCAEEQEASIMIFSKEAEPMLLQNKLNQYLLIEIDENDKLPKNICISCCTRLHTVCDFIEMARKSQDILFHRSIAIDGLQNNFTKQVTNNLVPDIPNEEPNIRAEIKIEDIDDDSQLIDDESQGSQMEVSVDPLLVLQNNLSTDENDEENDKADSGEVTYIPGLENENVTIKLIKKGSDPVIESQEQDIDNLLEERKKPKLFWKPFSCGLCHRSFLSELALKNHSWTHFNDDRTLKYLKCDTCNETFDYKCELISHLRDHRIKGTCKICGRVFRSEENLALHMDSHNTPAKAYVCRVCGRTYNNISNLKTHSITHTDDRPYHCTMCKKSFKRNQDLKFHINQHTGAKPYKCPFCEKAFASSGNCYSHRSRMHPGRKIEQKSLRRFTKISRLDSCVPDSAANLSQVKIPIKMDPSLWKTSKNTDVVIENDPVEDPNGIKKVYRYECNLCSHSFIKRDNYLYHMYKHNGVKPFGCSLCEMRFVTRQGRLVHHDRMHPKKDRPLSLISKNALLK